MYSVADLGQYSYGLYPHCHELFCSKSISPCRGVVFSSRSCCSPRVTERYQRSQRFSKTPADDFVSPSANCTRVGTHLSPDHCSSPPTFAEHLSRRDATVNGVPRSSGTLASLAKQSNKLLQPVTTRMGKCSSLHSSGEILFPINTSHHSARVYSARSRASRRALASAPKVDRMVLFEALLFQVMKAIGMGPVFSRSS